MKTEQLLEKIDGFKGKHILVVGDVMIDKYIWGSVDRVSPEAPVSVLDVKRENFVPGGAANTACNVTALGGKATVIGVTGQDTRRNVLIRLLKDAQVKFFFVNDKRPTTTKVRVMKENSQLLRIDYEVRTYISAEAEQSIMQFINNLEDIDVIVVSDYAKGCITENLMKEIIKTGKPVLVDPKLKHKGFYKGATLVKPNQKEAAELTGMKETDDVEVMGKKLVKELDASIIITRADKGVTIFEKEGSIHSVHGKAKEVFDVTGAGDTVMATLALSIAAGASLTEAAHIANHAGAVKVGKVGTASVTAEELKHDISKD